MRKSGAGSGVGVSAEFDSRHSTSSQTVGQTLIVLRLSSPNKPPLVAVSPGPPCRTMQPPLSRAQLSPA